MFKISQKASAPIPVIIVFDKERYNRAGKMIHCTKHLWRKSKGLSLDPPNPYQAGYSGSVSLQSQPLYDEIHGR